MSFASRRSALRCSAKPVARGSGRSQAAISVVACALLVLASLGGEAGAATLTVAEASATTFGSSSILEAFPGDTVQLKVVLDTEGETLEGYAFDLELIGDDVVEVVMAHGQVPGLTPDFFGAPVGETEHRNQAGLFSEAAPGVYEIEFAAVTVGEIAPGGIVVQASFGPGDGVGLGGTTGDVTTYSTTLVPEPGAAHAMVAGLLSLFAFARVRASRRREAWSAAVVLLALGMLGAPTASAQAPGSQGFGGSIEGYVRFPADPAYDPGVALTIEAWVYVESHRDVKTIVAHGDRDDRSYWLGLDGLNLRFARNSDDYASSTSTVPLETWTHVAVTYDGTTARFYVDGAGAGSSVIPHDGSGRTLPVVIGARPTPPPLIPPPPGTFWPDYEEPYTGLIHELHVWAGARSHAQIANERWEQPFGAPGLVFAAGLDDLTERVAGATGSRGFDVTDENDGVVPRPLIDVPRAPSTINVVVDGVEDPIEYAGAAELRMPYTKWGATGEAIAKLVHDDEGLAVLVTGISPTTGAWLPDDSWIALLLDPDYTRAPLSGPEHVQLRGPLVPGVEEMAYGNGVGGYQPAVPLPTGWEMAATYPTEFVPTYEFKVPWSDLGSVDEIDGFALAHFWIGGVGQDQFAPDGAWWNRPPSWARLRYTASTVVLPTVTVTGRIIDGLDPEAEGAGHQPVSDVQLMQAYGTSVYDTAEVDENGYFTFTNVPVPPGVDLIINVPDCLNCKYLQTTQTDTSGMLATGFGNWQATLPGCTSTICNYGSFLFQMRSPIGRIVIESTSPAVVQAEVELRTTPVRRFRGGRVTVNGRNIHPYTEVWVYGNCWSFPFGCEDESVRVPEETIDRTGGEETISFPMPSIDGSRTGRWTVVIRDLWSRPVLPEEQEEPPISWGDIEWVQSEPFRVRGPSWFAELQPSTWGLAMDNNDPAEEMHDLWGEFDGVYGENAYVCALGIGDACACRIRDPLYTLFAAVFAIWVPETGGVCAGMAAVSQRMRYGTMRSEAFDADAEEAGGLLGLAGTTDPPAPDVYDAPLCAPKRPANFWAQVRSHHSVQTSAEFMQSFFHQLDGGLDEVGGDDTFFYGDPAARLDELRTSQRYVTCETEVGGGHCMAPLRVDDDEERAAGEPEDPNVSTIRIIDNKEAYYQFSDEGDGYVEPKQDMTRVYRIDVDTSTNRYRYWRLRRGCRMDLDGNHKLEAGGSDTSPPGAGCGPLDDRSISYTPDAPGSDDVHREGVGMFNVPLTVWENERHAPGFREIVDFIFLLGWGTTDPVGDAVGELEFHPHGDLGDNPTQAYLLEPNAASRTLSGKVEGTEALYHAAFAGRVFQAKVVGSAPGEQVDWLLENEATELSRFRIGGSAGQVMPRVGGTPADDERVVYHFSALPLGGSNAYSLGTTDDERGAVLRNEGAGTVPYVVTMEVVDGSEAVGSRLVVGPIDLPAGAEHTLEPTSWPYVGALKVQEDTDGDGTIDSTSTQTALECGHIGAFPPPDKDQDGVPEVCEYMLMGLDSDDDGIEDGRDTCPTIYDPEQKDSDGDGVGDACDNCQLVANATQTDRNSPEDDLVWQQGVQRFGDACDADLDNDGKVGQSDVDGLYQACIGVAVDQGNECVPADFDSDGVVGASDFFSVLRPAMDGVPGPGWTE